MPHKHIQSRVKVPLPVTSKVRTYVKLSIHILSRYSLAEVYYMCHRRNIKVLSYVSLGGFISKKYLLHIEGYRSDITKLNRLLNSQ